MAEADGLISSRFRLGELLGSGGSASVFKAVDLDTGETIALKILHPHFSRSEQAREAFFAEARTAGDLKHPNIVEVIGMGVHAGDNDPQAWIAFEFAPGVSLSEQVEHEGELTFAETLAVADGVLSALVHAHDTGLVHRDISPANIMIARDPRGVLRASGVRLVDFGLADAAGRAALGSDVLRSTTLRAAATPGAAATPRAAATPGAATFPDAAPTTEAVPALEPPAIAGLPAPGATTTTSDAPAAAPAPADAAPAPPDPALGVLGNVSYLSPEQARGEPVDERGDLYQLGAVLYFALVGHAPFVRDSRRAVMLAHLASPPPVPSVERPGTPRSLDRLVVRAMLKDPASRFPDAAAMQVAVRAAAQHLRAIDGPAPDASHDATRVMTGAGAAALASAARLTADDVPASGDDTATAVLPRARARSGGSAASAVQTSPNRPTAAYPSGTRTGAPGAAPATAGAGRGRGAGTGTGIGPGAGAAPSPRGSAALWVFVALAAAIVVVAWALAAGNAGSATFGAGPETPAPEPTVSVTPTTTPVVQSVAAPMIAVPPLTALSLSAARDALTAAGLTVGTVTPQNSTQSADTVLSHSPAGGSQAAVGRTVDLVVASGSNVVPRTGGAAQSDALSSLRSSGFEVIITTRGDDAPQGTVLGTVPVEGTEARLGSTVTLLVAVPRSAAPLPTPTPTPTSTPTPTGTPAPDPDDPGAPANGG